MATKPKRLNAARWYEGKLDPSIQQRWYQDIQDDVNAGIEWFAITGGDGVPITEDTTLTNEDSVIFVDASAGDVTINLPTAVGILGRAYTIKKEDDSSNRVFIDPFGAETIDGYSLVTLKHQGSTRTIVSDNVQWRVIMSHNDTFDVNIQDQTTEIIDLHLSEGLSDLTLTANTAIDDTEVTGDVDVAFVPSVGDTVCLKEGTAFNQAEILTVTPNGGDNYTLEIDTPLDFAFTTAGGCSVRNINFAVDGSVTPVEFVVSPARLDTDVQWDIVRVLFSFVGPGLGGAFPAPDDTSFGTQDPLVRGIVLRKEDGTFKNIFNAKSNTDLKTHMYDLVYTDANRFGEYGVNCRRTFGGQSKNGVVIRLSNDANPADADRLVLIIQDDNTAHSFAQIVAQGHIVED